MPEQELEVILAEVQAELSLERKVEHSLLSAQKVEPRPSAQILAFLAQIRHLSHVQPSPLLIG